MPAMAVDFMFTGLNQWGADISSHVFQYYKKHYYALPPACLWPGPISKASKYDETPISRSQIIYQWKKTAFIM